jgi:hypothetical protein
MKQEKVFLVTTPPAADPSAGAGRYTIRELESALCAELEVAAKDIQALLHGTAPAALLPASLAGHPLVEILPLLRSNYHEAVQRIRDTYGEERQCWESIRLDTVKLLLQYSGKFFGTAAFHRWIRER